MTCLYVVPNSYIRSFRRRLIREGDTSLVMTLPGLAAQILKEGLVSYREDKVLEEIAVWQSVQEHAGKLSFFAPIAHYPGFIEELKLLFRQADFGEEIFTAMPQRGQFELYLLHNRYKQILGEHGIMDASDQMKRSIELAKARIILPEAQKIKLLGLGDLRPLEQELMESFARGRSLEFMQSQASEPVITVNKASDPIAEVEMIGEALRRQIEQGVPVERLGVAFPSPGQYLPIIRPVFDKLKIPWRVPEVSLRNTPVGKTVLTTFLAELQGWHKHHLELLTAPGWGFPLGLTAEEQRLLRLAPPLKGFPAWREYLGSQPGWDKVLEPLSELSRELSTRPLGEYGDLLGNLLDKLQPEEWILPEEDLDNWAELVKAWDGMHSIALGFSQFDWLITPEQFVQLLQSMLDSYQVQGRRVFSERVQIISVEQLGVHMYEQLYAGGLVEGQFPPLKGAHWLTKIKPHLARTELYERLIGSASCVNLYYPEVDRDGKLNLPATILPRVEEEAKTNKADAVHHPTLFLGKGFLEDQELLAELQNRVLKEGLSVSQLNRYANCPYQFFCSYVLQLVPDEEVSLELDARDHGNLVHSVLQIFWEEHLAGPLPSIEDGQARIEGLLRKEYAKLGAKPSNRLIRELRSFIRSDLTWAHRGFRPKYLEKWFQGLAITTPLGSVVIRGRIDRVDVNAKGAYVLYDYKTGSAPQINAMVAGKDVQIAAYLLAAQNILPQGTNVGAAYYLIGKRSRKGIFHADYYKDLGVTKGKNVLDEEGFADQNNRFAEILQNIAQGILQGAFPIEPASSRICSYCAFQGICRKEAGF
ncbi:MAG: hypothetical protein GX251_05375 [Firmicutes bacterium]|nr:hypothetical protein [Bacillota bacterium]